MPSELVQASYNAQAFHCPFCRTHSVQEWNKPTFNTRGHVLPASDALAHCRCVHCTRISIWVDQKLVFPRIVASEPPNPDLPAPIVIDFEEARRIAADSPRGAAALLRLAIQKLCVELGEPGKNINDDIAALVAKGLPVKIQQALDIVRVVGNNAVHPGSLDLTDDVETVAKLFRLVNIIVDVMISQPKHVADVFAAVVPPGAQAAIAKRDSKP